MKSFLPKAFMVVLLGVALLALRLAEPADADPRSSVAMPVQSLDSNNNIMGTATNPIYSIAGNPVDGGSALAVSISSDAGQSITAYGAGSAGSPAGGVVSVQGVSGGTSVPVDPTAGDLLNTRFVSNTTITSTILWDAGSTFHLVAFRATNEGALTAWPQIYCGQSSLDAGGTADAGTAPSYQIRCPAGTPCDWQMPSSTTCGPGATLYSSSTVGLLTVDAGQQAMTYEAVVR